MIKFSDLRHKSTKQSDPSLAWFVFQKIYHMYIDINNKEQSNSDVILKSMSEHEE